MQEFLNKTTGGCFAKRLSLDLQVKFLYAHSMAKARIFIIHGAYGNPEENWFPWLKRELEKYGYEVIIPAFPTPKDQSLSNWQEVFEPYLEKIDQNSIFVGHSLGPAFILSILEKINIRVKGCFFVAGFIGLLDDPLDEINRTFTDRPFNWNKIRESSSMFRVINSDNDPYISLEKAEELADHLEVKIKFYHNAGHFNEKAGFLQFTELLEEIRSVIENDQ